MKALIKSAAIRLATIDDIPSLIALENRCFTADLLNAPQLRRFIHNRTVLTFVSEANNSIIASAVIMFRKRASFARLYSIAVDPDYQGCGFADLLHESITSAVIDHGCKEIKLEVRQDNIRAIQFYTKRGYTHFGAYKCFYEDGADAIRMIKYLNHP